MTEGEAKKANNTQKEILEKTVFICQHCHQEQPIEDMRLITRFFPMMVVCSDCEQSIR